MSTLWFQRNSPSAICRTSYQAGEPARTETPLRSIRGEASLEDYETLREEGIAVMRVPILKKEEMN